MKHFWVIFILNEALAVLSAYVNTASLSDAQKQAIMKVVISAQEALQVL